VCVRESAQKKAYLDINPRFLAGVFQDAEQLFGAQRGHLLFSWMEFFPAPLGNGSRTLFSVRCFYLESLGGARAKALQYPFDFRIFFSFSRMTPFYIKSR